MLLATSRSLFPRSILSLSSSLLSPVSSSPLLLSPSSASHTVHNHVLSLPYSPLFPPTLQKRDYHTSVLRRSYSSTPTVTHHSHSAPPKLFNGLAFAITGSFSEKREDIIKLIEKHGGEVKGSVTSQVFTPPPSSLVSLIFNQLLGECIIGNRSRD